MRLRSLPIADGTVRPVLEANVVDVAGGAARRTPRSSTRVTGKVLVRHNKVDNVDATTTFQRAPSPPTAAGPSTPSSSTDDLTRSINAVAVGAARRRLRRQALRRGDALLVTGDLGTSPEVATYTAAVDPRRHLLRAGLPVRRRRPWSSASTPSPSARSDTAAPGTGDVPANPRGATSPPTRRSTPPTRRRPTRSSAAGTLGRPAAPPRPARCATSRPSARGTPIAAAADLHHRRQQRQHPRGVAQPADPRRRCPGAGLRRRVTTPPSSPTLEQQQVRPRPARARRQRHRRLGGQPVRRPQPDARLLLLPRLHRGQLQPAARQRRPRRRRAATRRSATPRPAPSPAAARPSSAATTPTRSPCRTASPASPTSTSSSRSPARSTPPAPTAASTWASSATSTPTPSATGWSAAPTRA